jgi:hypothetical protein
MHVTNTKSNHEIYMFQHVSFTCWLADRRQPPHDAAPHCCRRTALLFRRLCAAAAETKILPIGHLASLESLSSYYSLYHHIL